MLFTLFFIITTSNGGITSNSVQNLTEQDCNDLKKTINYRFSGYVKINDCLIQGTPNFIITDQSKEQKELDELIKKVK